MNVVGWPDINQLGFLINPSTSRWRIGGGGFAPNTLFAPTGILLQPGLPRIHLQPKAHTRLIPAPVERRLNPRRSQAPMEVESSAESDVTVPQPIQDPKAKPIVACLRCRDQKLRCDRELPSCRRCHRQSATCIYPSPPDRKRIAQRASRSRASKSTSRAENALLPESHTVATPGKRQRTSDDTREPPAVDFGQTEDAESAELPPTEVGLLLLEVYFKRIYHATLLFHKSIAFQLYLQNDIPGYLLRAIFAHAAVFLQKVDSSDKPQIKIFPVHDLFQKSWSWARAASREVLSRADEPSMLRIQALQALQFYYFSRGDIQRTTVHATLAHQLSQLLGYDKLYEEVHSHSGNRMLRFEHEMGRRCFWASWCSSCLGSHEIDSLRACEKVAGLPLPANFAKGGSTLGVELTLGPKMKADWMLSIEDSARHGTNDSTPSLSLMAELIRLVGIL
jgi:hypothetical protein